jgi:hypothetical protein
MWLLFDACEVHCKWLRKYNLQVIPANEFEVFM